MSTIGFEYPTSIYPGGKMKESYSYWEVEALVREAYDTGIRKAEARIIALLEAWVADDSGDFDMTLALIKGEQ